MRAITHVMRIVRLAGTALRGAVTILAAVLVLWSFSRVLSRPFLDKESDGAEIELVLMHWSGEGGSEEDAIVEQLLADFEASYPNTRVRRINPGDAASFYTKLQTMTAAGDPPDVFYVGSERVPAFADAGMLLAVESFLEDDAATGRRNALSLEDFYPATLEAFRFDGARSGSGPLYGIPKDFTTIGFYANLDLFRRAGVELPPADWTWDDFIGIARRIGALEGCTGAEFVTWPAMIRLYLATEGLDVASPDFRESWLHHPEVLAALDRLRAWRHDETSALTSGKSQVATGASVFLTGRVGMAGPFGRWVVPSYRKIEDFEWDFLPLPRGEVRANAVATVAWAISSRTAHPQEAWSLVRHLGGARSQAMAAPLGLAVPTLRKVAESPAFLDPNLAPRNDRAFLEQAEYARALAWPANPKFESGLEIRLNEALKTGTRPLEVVAREFEESWRRELESPLARGSFAPVPWWGLARWAGIGLAALLVVLAFWWRMTRGGRLAESENRAGWALVSPWLLGFLLFLAFPIGLSLLLSLTNWNGITPLANSEWVGAANYQELLSRDGRFATSLRVTAYYALLAVPLGQLFALGSASLLNQRLAGQGFFRSAWYLPSVLAGVGVAVLWRWVFDGDNGLLNRLLDPLLSPLGVAAPQWLDADAERWGPPAFAIMSLWLTGSSMVIYLAGLRNIPDELYEAARIDGAGRWRRLRHITLPMLSPVIFFNVIMAIIGSFQVFTQAFVMTGGQPGDLTRFYVLYLYNQAFDYYEMGYASALAWLLLLLVLGLTWLVMAGSRRLVYYEALQG